MTTTKVGQWIPLEVRAEDAANAAQYAAEMARDGRALKAAAEREIMKRWCAGDGFECVNHATWTDEDTGLRFCPEHAR